MLRDPKHHFDLILQEVSVESILLEGLDGDGRVTVECATADLMNRPCVEETVMDGSHTRQEEYIDRHTHDTYTHIQEHTQLDTYW